MRLTQPFHVLEKFFIDLQCERLVVYEHTDGKRPHVHALVVGATHNTTTLKARLAKVIFPKKWAKDEWAFMTRYKVLDQTEKVNENLITYMSKGTLSPCHVRGYTEAFIEEKRSAWVQHTKPKKKTYADIVDEVIQELPECTNLDETIIQLIIAKLRQNRMVCGRYKIRDLFDSVLAWRDPMTFQSRIKGTINFRSIES